MDRPVALVVDRDAAVRALVSDVLEREGFHSLGAESTSAAREMLGTRSVALVLVSLDTDGARSVELIEHVRRLTPPPLVVGLGAADRFDAEALQGKLFDLLPEPTERERIVRLARRCASQLELLDQLRRLRADLRSREGYHGIVGRSEAMERFRNQIERLAHSTEPVWIVGEPGSGRELAARTLHAASPRSDGVFAVLACAEVRAPEAFVGAAGVWARAEGGTLFLEELPDMRLDLQEDLLREIERRSAAGPTAARVVVGAREDPAHAVAGGRLAEGLQRRLGRHALALAPLRERREDIVLLAQHFINAICEINHLPPIRITPEALAALERHDWPGNVQELRNAIEQAVILSEQGKIRPTDLPDRVREAAAGVAPGGSASGLARRPFREAKRDVVEAFERAYLSDLLAGHGGNVTAASQQAGMLRSALQRLLRKYGLKSADFRSSAPRRAARAAVDEAADEGR